MTVTSGFFNSLDGDRKYDANDFSRLFEGIIKDGVFANVGNAFQVLAGETSNMLISVGSGRAYFEGHWIYNDAALVLTVEDAHPTLNRIDGVILTVDERDSMRKCYISIKKGTAAVTPTPIGLYEDAERLEILLAEITVGKGVTGISQSKIKSYIGTNYCPYVVGAVKNIEITDQLLQWDATFYEWFNALQAGLEGDVATALLARVISLESQVGALQTVMSQIGDVPDISSGTSAPSGGTSGDIYLRYV